MAITVIKANELAERLQVKVSQVKLLLRAGYIRMVPPKAIYLGNQKVTLPSPAAIEWMKAGFTPLRRRPIVKLTEVAKMADLLMKEVKKLCVGYDITIYHDLAYGELITIDGLEKFMDGLYGWRDPGRFDRGAFLFFLRGAKRRGKIRVAPLSFSQKLEVEIKRIAHLPEPERTYRAGTLIEAYREAKTVADCLGKYSTRMTQQIVLVEQKIEKLVEELT